jgi:hypothetical protein
MLWPLDTILERLFRSVGHASGAMAVKVMTEWAGCSILYLVKQHSR